ncbi:MAG: LacI family transcriptional regulator [Bacteroidetes bacterium]|nr:LacI family transcriptional regulator [Bacteroidota bacterium]
MINKGRVTIKDIARDLNLSTSTVSRALRNHPDISDATKKLVVQYANENDYHPDAIAQSLKNMRTNTIGVMVPEIKHDFFSAALNGIEDVTYAAGFTIMVCKSNESYEREVLNTRALLSNRVAGFIVSIAQNSITHDHFQSLKDKGIPLVFFDRIAEDIEASKVMIDDYEAAFKATEYLINKGYKKIAHFAGPDNMIISRERHNGYKDAFEKNNIKYDKNYVIRGGLNEEDGMIAFQKLQELPKMPDAILAVTDPVAIGAFVQINQSKLKIPDDIALMGFSNNAITSLVSPSITTVAQPAYEMGSTAAKMLLEEIHYKGSYFQHRTEVLSTQLIEREST